MPTALDDRSFMQFVAEHPYAFVHFWAPWNNYDVTMKRIIERIEPDFKSRVAFGMLDIDPEPHLELCVRHGVQGPPFYAYYGSGSLQKTEVGSLAEIELRNRLDSFLSWSQTEGANSS